MSAQSAAPKSTSRWGSFLQQAVAGVESRLDTILADDDNTNARPKDTSNQRAEKTESSSASPNPRSSTGDTNLVSKPSLHIANATIRDISKSFPKQEK